MRAFLKGMVRVGMLLGIAAVIARLWGQYRGSPTGVGEEGFSFGDASDPFEVDESTLGGDVDPEFLAQLVCPVDRGPLEVVDGRWLVNHRNGYRYPISDGIPVMLAEVGERYRDPALVVAPASGEARPAGPASAAKPDGGAAGLGSDAEPGSATTP